MIFNFPTASNRREVLFCLTLLPRFGIIPHANAIPQ